MKLYPTCRADAQQDSSIDTMLESFHFNAFRGLIGHIQTRNRVIITELDTHREIKHTPKREIRRRTRVIGAFPDANSA